MELELILEKINYNEEDLKNHDAIGAIIKDKDGRLLMLKHNKYGFWTVPVGKVKHDQTVEEGLVMELKEELNIIVRKYKKLMIYSKIFKRERKNITVTTHIFEIEKYTGVIKNAEPDKHSEMRWLSIENMKNMNLSETTKEYLKYIGEL
jgi:ADP-ribose pyrophosphatase YjhB (NUDIX family)